MAIIKGYTTDKKIQDFLGVSITEDLYPYIAAAEKMIDNYTNRNFIADSSAQVRYYDGDGSNNLIIDDCVEITKVEKGVDSFGDNFIELSKGGSNGYYEVPSNHQLLNFPIRKLIIRGYLWNEGYQNHKITARWGFSDTVPDDISFATTMIAAGIYQNGQTGQAGGIKSEKIGEYSITYNNDNQIKEFQKAIKILNSYKKYEF